MTSVERAGGVTVGPPWVTRQQPSYLPTSPGSRSGRRRAPLARPAPDAVARGPTSSIAIFRRL